MANLHEWLDLAFRWFHVFVAILWIGSTAFFTWLDTRMRVEKDPATGKEEVWMVHSGGFYRVEKRTQPDLAHPLHWWKFEALFTWLTGFCLLLVVYYWGGTLLVHDPTDPSAGPGVGAARAIGIAALLLGWTVYDLIWISPLGRLVPVASALCLALLVGTDWLLAQYLSARAAYYHVGAIMGTIMTANVWMRIIPAQRRMVAAVKAGQAPDLALGERAKMRSKHNTFMVVPLVLIMISNHFGAATGGYSPWYLAGFLAIGFGVRKMINAHDASTAS
jgi:uncharacterized membrane protein